MRGRRCKRRALRWITVAALATCLLVSNVQAEGFATALPPQSLADALDVFSRATGYQIVYRADLTAGLSTPGAEAGLSVVDTLRQLLRGTGLGFRFVNDRAIAIIKLPSGDNSHPSAPKASIDPVARSRFAADVGALAGADTGSNTRGDNAVKHRGLLGRIAAFFTLCGSLAATGAVCAQEEPVPGAAKDELQEIVVTGTLIRGVAPVGTEVVAVTRDDIVDSGVVSTQDLLSTIPAITNSFNSVQNPNSGVSGITIVRPNIHNIGASGGNTTLVLFDGHDVVGAGILQTTPDAGMLPPNALQSVEVVADGGSAVYGADAVGGIVNFITRKHIEGIETDVHYGLADQYHAGDANLTGGHEWSGGSFLVSYSFRSNSDVFGGDRAYYSQYLTPFGGTDHRVATCPLGNVSAGGVNYALPGLVANTQNLCDQDKFADLFPAETQNSLFAAFSQDLSSDVTFDTTAYYTYRETRRLAAQITSSGTITNANPYFIPVGGATSETVRYSYAAAGGNSLENRTSIGEGGVTPELRFKLGGDWDLTTTLNYGRSTTTGHSPEINPTADAAALAGTTPATALDPYNIAQTNKSILNSILHYEQYATNTQQLYEGRVITQGTALHLPGGDVRLALGAQYEDQTESAVQTDAPDGDLTGAATSSASLKSASAFGEALLPIVGGSNAFAGVRALNLDLALRYDHYDQFGGTTNPKYGLNWRPIDALTIRATYGTSFVAPSLADLAGSVDFRAQVLSVSPFGPGPFNTRPTILLAGGGTDLKPMTSKTYTFGADFAPQWLPSTALTTTYWNTAVDHLINIFPFYAGSYYFNTFPGKYLVNPTLAQAEALIGNERIQGPSLAQLYSNAATTPYAILDAERTNLGNEFIQGLDFNLSFKQSTSFGSVMASVAGTYVLSQQSQPLGGPRESMFIAGNNISRLLATAQVSASVGQLTARATMNYSSGFVVSEPGQTWVGAFHPVNLLLAYKFSPPAGWVKDLSVTLNVNNIFDEQPAFENQTGGITPDGTGNGGTVGRFFQLGLHSSF
jgi:iron complex outermembrane recepter protein